MSQGTLKAHWRVGKKAPNLKSHSQWIPLSEGDYGIGLFMISFLGVHFTRMIEGVVECGPNAVLAFGREAYDNSVSIRLICSIPSPILASKLWRLIIGKWAGVKCGDPFQKKHL